jgi:hypothetical protein
MRRIVLLGAWLAWLLGGKNGGDLEVSGLRSEFRELVNKVIGLICLLGTRFLGLRFGSSIRIAAVLLNPRSPGLNWLVGLALGSNDLTHCLIGLLGGSQPGLIELLLFVDGREDTKTLEKSSESTLIKSSGILHGRDKEVSELHKLSKLGRKRGLLLLDLLDRSNNGGIINGGHFEISYKAVLVTWIESELVNQFFSLFENFFPKEVLRFLIEEQNPIQRYVKTSFLNIPLISRYVTHFSICIKDVFENFIV